MSSLLSRSSTGGSGSVRIRGHIKSFYSAGELLKAPVSNESWINMILWYLLVGYKFGLLRLWCLFREINKISIRPLSKWLIVVRGRQSTPSYDLILVEPHLFVWWKITPVFWVLTVLYPRKNWCVRGACGAQIWKIRSSEQARQVKTVKAHSWIAKSTMGQTVGGT